MAAFLLCAAALAADPSPEQTQLLTVFRDEFVQITPGKGKFPKTFTMGRAAGGPDRERPARQVTFGYSFSVAKYEVPQNLWEAVMGENPSRWKGPRNSVEMLSFEDAEKFCAQATRQMRAAGLIKANEVIRLPSEAEWEYVARAGTDTLYSFGDSAAQLDDYAWHTGNAAGNDPPVGAKKPNPWGLYDVHGYLWEWCADPAHDDYQGAPADGSVWLLSKDKTRGVLRGGSWKDPVQMLTSSYRYLADRQTRDDAVGLRCVLATQ